MTAREELERKITKVINSNSAQSYKFKVEIESVLSSYKIQMKAAYEKDPQMTAREYLVSVLCDAFSGSRDLSVAMELAPFRIQNKIRKKDVGSPGARCEVISISEYKDSMIPTSYGYVAGGPKRKKSSQKMCPKCKSIGLYLASGYKERYYSCVYCGFHQELEAKTYQY
jgi:hypothetical protein